MTVQTASSSSDPQAPLKADFAERLRAAIERKGWSASEAARQVARLLEDGDKFGRAHIWHYMQGRALPRGRYLLALSRALEVEPGDLLPGRPVPGATQPSPFGMPSTGEQDVVHVRDYGDGTAMLQVSQRMPWPRVLQIMQIVKTREA